MHQRENVGRVTMPKWPAWVLFATMAACAYPAVSASAAADQPAPQAAAQPTSFASAAAR
jgi:hypothetical protein